MENQGLLHEEIMKLRRVNQVLEEQNRGYRKEIRELEDEVTMLRKMLQDFETDRSNE